MIPVLADVPLLVPGDRKAGEISHVTVTLILLNFNLPEKTDAVLRSDVVLRCDVL